MSVSYFPIKAVILVLMLIALSSPAAAAETYSHLWSGFATPLSGRSPEQRRNAARAAAALNGTVIQPGRGFSFNKLVGARDSDKGYLTAPMIDMDGTLRDVPGGGICQLATTIYNAALLAGMQIVERHPHSRAVRYVPPGRDATIASWRKDLKFTNPHDVPLLLKVELSDERLTVALWGATEKPFTVELRSDSVSMEPETAVISGGRNGMKAQRGVQGYAVITRRITTRNGIVIEELLSEDYYPPPSRLIADGSP